MKHSSPFGFGYYANEMLILRKVGLIIGTTVRKYLRMQLEDTTQEAVFLIFRRQYLAEVKRENRIFLEEKKIIEEIVEKQDCVIVGRCASYILRDRPDCLKVFVHSSIV